MYLSNPDFARLIDEEIIKGYMHGMHGEGIRTEDDVLMIKQGFDNLTLAPNGDEMLDIIRDVAKCKHGVAYSSRF